MGRPQVSTRVDNGFYEDFEEFIEEQDISQAEAARMLLRDGMEAQERNELADKIDDLDNELRADGGVASKNEFAHLEQTVTNLQKKLDETRRKSNALNMALFAALMFVVLSEAGILTGVFVLAGGFIVLFGVVFALFYSQFYGGEV